MTWRLRDRALVPQEQVRQLQMNLDGSDVAVDVRGIMVKFVIGLAGFWIVLMGLGAWFMVWRRK